jgi:AAA15 family ATPase/GTPase
MGNIHIKSLNIESFRGIKNLKLENFTGINLFSGINNSGKTTILEILQTSGNPCSPYVWTNFDRAGETSNPIFERMLDLFPASEKELVIAYSKDDDINGLSSIKLKAELNKVKSTKREYCKEAHIECEPGEEYLEAEMIKLHTDFYYNDKLEDSFKVFNVTRFDSFIENVEKPYEKYQTLYLPSNINYEINPFITKIFSDNQSHKELVSVLQLFDDDIIDIVPTVREYSVPFSLKNSYQIRSKKFGKLVPFGIYGDGLRKAFYFVVAVLATKNGVLLIDEFETAIHTSVMDSLFMWIFKACKENNVQLFMTTHSKEALQKVLALNSIPEFKEDVTLYTLYKIDGKNLARRLSAERAIEAAENFGQELR